MTLSVAGAAAPNAATSIDPEQIRDLEKQRSKLVDSYVGAHPTGDTWAKRITGGTLAFAGAAAAGVGVAMSIRGRGSLYQGLSLMTMGPIALGAGGGIGYAIGSSVADVATRPTGEAGEQQVATTRASLREQIANIDEQLSAADGRRAGQLPDVQDTTPPGPGIISTGKYLGAGAGLGLLATATATGVNERAFRRLPQRNAQMLALGALTLGAATFATIGASNRVAERDSSEGGVGTALRNVAAPAAAFATLAALAGKGLGTPAARAAVGGLAGAAIGSIAHTVTYDSHD